MPKKTFVCSVFKPQSQVPTTGNVITSIREYTSVEPSHKNEAGVGGTGANPAGGKPNNSTFMRFEELTTIPKGAKINSAILNWGVNSYDWRTGVTHKVCACKNFNNTLTGVNQPTVYDNADVSSYWIPRNHKSRFDADITTAIQNAVDKGLKCIKIYTEAGKNRKYLNNVANLTVDYKANTTKPTFTITGTDCTSLSYANTTVTVNVNRPSGVDSSDKVYYSWTITSGSSKYSTSWSTNTTANLPMQGSAGSSNTIKVSSSLYSNGEYATTSDSKTITRNAYPVVKITPKTSNNSVISGNSVITSSNSVSFDLKITDASIKKNSSLSASIYVNGNLYSNLSSNISEFNINSISDKTLSVYAVVSDGFLKSTSNTVTIEPALPPVIQLDSLPDRIPCNETLSFKATAILRNSNTYIQSFNLKAFSKINSQSTQVGSITGINNILTLNLNIPVYDYTNMDETEYYFVASLTDNINQTVTFTSNVTKANRIPENVQIIELSREKADINGVITAEQELSAGYDKLYVPINESVLLNWNKCEDRDNDLVTYNVKIQETQNIYSCNTNNFNYEITENGNYTFSVRSKDYLNVGSYQSANVVVSNSIPVVDAPSVNLKCYSEYIEGESTSDFETINGVKLIDVTDSLADNEITKYLKFIVNSKSTESCSENNMRFGVSIYTVKNDVKTLKQTHISKQGEFELFIQYDINTDLETKLEFSVYYIDRFDIISTNITEMGPYDVLQGIPVPQVLGTLGGGYRWLFGNYENVQNKGNLLTPIFCCNVLNPNDTTYSIAAKLYDSDQTYLETAIIYPNTTVNSSSTEGIPSENIKAWKFTTELIPENDYYVILEILFTNGILASKSAFTDNNKYTVSQKFNNDRVFSDHWKVDEIIKTSHINLINSYIKKLYESYNFIPPTYIFDVDKGDLILAETNDKTIEIIPAPYNDDPTVVEPLNYNLCPNFNQWYDQNGNSLENEPSYDLNSIQLSEDLTSITSKFIPWKGRSDQFKLSFNITNISGSDIGKIFQYQLEFYDYYKNQLGLYTHYLSLAIPDNISSITPTNNYNFFFENIYNTEILGSHILLNNVSYIKLNIALYEDDNLALKTLPISDVLLTDDLNANYIIYDTYDYSPIQLHYGAKNSWIQNLDLALYEFYQKLCSNYLNYTGIETQPAVIYKSNLNYVLLENITIEDIVKSSENIELAKCGQSIRYFGDSGTIKIPISMIPQNTKIKLALDTFNNTDSNLNITFSLWTDVNTKQSDITTENTYTTTANVRSLGISTSTNADFTLSNLRIQNNNWTYTKNTVSLHPYMRNTLITADQDIKNLSFECGGIFSYLKLF